MESPYLEGIIKISTKGTGYLTTNPKIPSVEINPLQLGTALPGDKVRVRLDKINPLIGEVVEILERRKMEFVGTIEFDQGNYYLVPDDRRVYKDIIIPEKSLNGAKAGEKVLAKITDWSDSTKDPIGEIVEIIGTPGQNETEMTAIVYERGFRTTFSKEIETEAKKIKNKEVEILAEEETRRLDFRKVLTFTVDPIDAKDFDDALSFRKIDNEKYEVGIHIADVSHYVTPDTAIDREAQKRATSIYLVDRTIPMLPEILSNDLCSLNPDEEKLTFSVVVTFTDSGEIIKTDFAKTIIKSDKRLTYEDGQKILNNPSGPLAEALVTLNKLAKIIRRKKMEAGAISFENDEIKFELDKNGSPVRIFKKSRQDIHLLIEDFMLLANRRVAEYVSKIVKDEPGYFIYRIHDLPDRERLENLSAFARPLGYHLPIDKETISGQTINNFLNSVSGTPEETMMKTATMRAMAKAVYDTKNIGHYGLAFPYYTHFTSPIRRYPDIMVHRLLNLYHQGKTPQKEMLAEYAKLATHSSFREIEAQDAERDSIRYKQIEFISRKIGQVVNGVISGLAKWGIFIQETETLTEGLVSLSSMKDDFYIFDEKNYCLLGKNSGKKYRLGDPIRVKVIKADLPSRTVDFEFV